jgi:hypothetical protein
MKKFRVEITDNGEKDVMYIIAPSLLEAKERLRNFCGEIPESLLIWSEVERIPKNQIPL